MEEGTTLKNRYRLERLLGRGGMADVYLAFDQRRQVHVALKMLREDLAEDPEFVRRFQREAEALARLDHPNIVRFYSFEQDGAAAFIVLDYIPGITARRRLTDVRGPLPLDEITRILHEIVPALHYAHDQGIIHRDLKPANIMLREDGRVLLSDFGIAKAMESATVTTMTVGTPAYMAPEQVLGRPVDPRTDVYSLGVVLYELATGRRPFTGEAGRGTSTLERIRDEHLHAAPPDPRQFNPELPAPVAEVILRALDKWPEERWPDVLSLGQAWDAALGIPAMPARMARPVLVAPPPMSRPASPPSPPVPSNSVEHTPQPAAQRRLIIGLSAASGVLLVGLLALGLFVVFRGSGSGPTAKLPGSVGQTVTWPAPIVIATQTSPPMPSATPLPPTVTATPMPPSPTLEPTATPTPAPPTPTRSLGIGSTMVSPVDGMTLVYVPAGEFLMGSAAGDPDAASDERPQHRVYLDAFWIDRTEVTKDQYQKCMAAGKCAAPSCSGTGRRNHPVVCVSWQDAANYCAWAERRLPTEAEWEKAARGMDGRKYPWGNQGVTGNLLNFCDSNCAYPWGDNAVNDGYRETAPVGSYPAGASPYGALDMAGNVWEWVADWYDEKYYASSPTRNPLGPGSGHYRVVRGGSWLYVRWDVRAANRSRNGPDSRNDGIGFRCALSP